jgi:hypothetical protein
MVSIKNMELESTWIGKGSKHPKLVIISISIVLSPSMSFFFLIRWGLGRRVSNALVRKYENVVTHSDVIHTCILKLQIMMYDEKNPFNVTREVMKQVCPMVIK